MIFFSNKVIREFALSVDPDVPVPMDIGHVHNEASSSSKSDPIVALTAQVDALAKDFSSFKKQQPDQKGVSKGKGGGGKGGKSSKGSGKGFSSCILCSKKGHTMSNCPNAASYANQKCKICGGIGHPPSACGNKWTTGGL